MGCSQTADRVQCRDARELLLREVLLQQGVRMKPGPTLLTRIPWVAYSMAAFLLRPTTPCLAAT